MMINQFLNYLRYERNSSPLTVQTYEESLREFESYLSLRDNGLSLGEADADLIRDWMESLMDKGHTASTINKKLSALRSFYRFALNRKLVDKDPAHCITGPKKSKPLPQFLREREMDNLLDKLEWDDDNYKEVRARTILLLLYETGLRRSELVGLDDADVDFAISQLKVTGKRNKQRIVPFGTELAETLKRYKVIRDEQQAKHSDALFLDNKGKRMTGMQVYNIVRKYLTAVTSLKKRSPHVLRHTFATAMLNNGAGLESIKNLLGHESVSTTEIYTHTTFEQLKRIYKEAHPRA
jgi:integrase/recombinase XerC